MPGSSPGTASWSPARPSSGILRGITRTTLFDLAAKLGLKIEERGFTVAEAKAAREAFITAATTVVMPVVAIDGDTGRQRPSRLDRPFAAQCLF